MDNIPCDEIINGASTQICESVSGTNGNLCKYDAQNKKCVEEISEENDNTETEEEKNEVSEE